MTFGLAGGATKSSVYRIGPLLFFSPEAGPADSRHGHPRSLCSDAKERSRPVLILHTQRRSSGHAYAALIRVAWGEEHYTLVLQHHPVGERRWQTSLYRAPVTPNAVPLTEPAW